MNGMERSIAGLRKWKLAHIRPLADRFWEKVHKTDGCWIWTGAKNRFGYGSIGGEFPSHRRQLKAHRLSLQLAGVNVPTGSHVCHHCDNPSCVRPDHLFIGDAKANSRDALAKGRLKTTLPRYGSDHPKAKLQWRDVYEIRMAAARGETSKSLAYRYNMSHSAMWSVVTGKTYRQLRLGKEAR